MSDEEFEKKKKNLFEELRSADTLNEDLEERVVELYGSRGEKAVEVIKKDDVREKDGRWFVQGSEDEYEIVQSYCSCYDYVLNVATEKAEVDLCYHALAKKIREILDSD